MAKTCSTEQIKKKKVDKVVGLSLYRREKNKTRSCTREVEEIKCSVCQVISSLAKSATIEGQMIRYVGHEPN